MNNLTFQQYSQAVTNYLESKTDFYDLVSTIEETYDFDGDNMLIGAAQLTSEAYDLDVPVELATDVIYTGFVQVVLLILEGFKLDKNKLN